MLCTPGVLQGEGPGRIIYQVIIDPNHDSQKVLGVNILFSLAKSPQYDCEVFFARKQAQSWDPHPIQRMLPLLRPFTIVNAIGAGENDRVGAGGDGGSGDHANPGRARGLETICGGPGDAPLTTAEAPRGPAKRGEIGRPR